MKLKARMDKELKNRIRWPPVAKKLANGADLMLPGVVVDKELGLKAYNLDGRRLQKVCLQIAPNFLEPLFNHIFFFKGGCSSSEPGDEPRRSCRRNRSTVK